ncbi:MAG: MOSC domain-containing protein [Candidatus Dormiibacterota bacterium]
MPSVLSVNVGRRAPSTAKDVGMTGIDKRPVSDPVEIRDPGTSPVSGLAGDAICDTASHGGHDQAVYAYAREDLDTWERDLGRKLRSGMFGENVTTLDLDVTGALIGERWRVGERCILEVSCPRIPCRTFAAWLRESAWERRFTLRAAPGTYLRVIEPGLVSPGDDIAVIKRPTHQVTVQLMFRALTRERDLVPRLVDAGDALPAEVRAMLAASL